MTEIISLRTENSKTYDLGKGKRQAVISIGAIHYKDNYADASEQWKDINLNWEGNRIVKTPYELTLEGNKITVRDKKSGEVSTIELLEIGGIPIPAQAWGKSKGLAKAFATDLEIVAGNTRVSFARILKSDKAPVEATYRVTGNIPLRVGARDEEGELPVEWAVKDGILTETFKPDRPIKYPVRIDPTLTIQPSAKDNYLAQAAATTNYGTTTDLRLRSYNAANQRCILEFSLASLPAGAVITSATLELYYYLLLGTDPVGRTYWAYRLTRTDWVEIESCWDYYKGTTVWTAAGGDYTTDDGASTAVPASYGWMSWNVLAQTQYAQTNSITVEFLVRDGTEDNATIYGAKFYSKDYTDDPTLCPKLVIEYTTVTPKTSSDTGAGVDAKVTYPAVTHSRSETGSGAETMPARGFLRPETGSGVDTKASGNPLVSFPVRSDVGSGIDALTALFGILTRSDTGLGVDAKLALAVALIKADIGSGLDSTPMPSAILAGNETGSGIDAIIARLLASFDIGTGIEVSSLLKELFASELGWGSDSLIAKIEMPTKGGGMKLWT